ncbi:polysaccharide deacetylase family protein [Pseudonocardia asaccharolytica]|uniref:NodB homology domain-containing protein n=1 Tax=Pseudonocardia asaccharolytica DSM 44247 = NBRC 16224 TaxID=1123024 RepID=A0A511CWI0_9PSEU|nr:polysaccharide deacetylase family protein [Pseudonocardia asaccharolytica]GEL16912.1 hypothetical protein PA7_07490 [Pseudonocardia asaccharolytica DSM 44247 = NBRC 16224]
MRGPTLFRDSWAGGHELVVLGWHNIESTCRYPAEPGSGTRSIARQLRALRALTSVVPLDPALATLRGGGRLPPRAVALTFDDGYRDNLALAMPLLRELGLPATFFLVPGFLGRRHEPWWEHLAWAFANATVRKAEFAGISLDVTDPAARRRSLTRVEPLLKSRDETGRRRAVAELVESMAPAGSCRCDELFMDWDEARIMARSGMSIGSHTMCHAVLAREDQAVQRRDLRESRALLEHALELPVASLAYPNGEPGDYDGTTLAAARAAGYAQAVTTHGVANRSTTEPFEIRRRVLAPGDNAAVVVAGLVRGVRRERARSVA